MVTVIGAIVACVIGLFLGTITLLKTASLIHGAIFIARRGGAVRRDILKRVARGASVAYEDIEKAHGHEPLVQFRLAGLRPRIVARLIRQIYVVYVLVPIDLLYVVVISLTTPSNRLVQVTLMLVGIASAAASTALVVNEFCKAGALAETYKYHWSVTFQKIFQDWGIVERPNVALSVASSLLGIVVIAGFAALSCALATVHPSSYGLSSGGAKPSPWEWVYLSLIDPSGVIARDGLAQAIRFFEWLVVGFAAKVMKDVYDSVKE